MKMTPNLGSWIHNFTVTDTQTHKGGYTIYKITSTVFPRLVPQALTCLVVWKRFHEVKRLHRELNRRHKSLHLAGKLPEPTDSSYFKRFDPDVIERRKKYILQLLDFAAQEPALYKCYPFTQFFCDATTPNVSPLHYLHLQQSSNTRKSNDENFKTVDPSAEICDNVDKCYDTHTAELPLIDPECDKRAEFDKNSDNNDKVQTESGQETKELDICANKTNKIYSRLLTPMASIESDDGDYIYEAALEFSHAVQAEVNLEYREAHMRYKRGVDVLLNGSLDDPNDDRRFIAKAKIAKYLARVNEIYERFLRNSDDNVDGALPNKTNFHLSVDETDPNNTTALFLERPWNHLAKYKVLKILDERVMQVQCITEPQHPVYVMKGIEKPSSNSPTQSIFLPQQVPYMVDLLGFFQSEQKIFLLLKHAEGGRFFDYIQSYTPNVKKRRNYAMLFPEITPIPADVLDVPSTDSIEVSSFADTTSTLSNLQETTEFSELVRNSQQLLQSVSHTLKEVKKLDYNVETVVEDGGVHSECILTNKSAVLPEASLKQWARELVVAIYALHGKGIILGDLHMDNLLLGSKGQLMLTYFYQNEGLLFEDNHVHKAINIKAALEHFVAPERPLTFKSDWWSFGVILYQLILNTPFKEVHPGNIDLYGCVQYPEGTDISECAQDLLEHLIQQSPEERFDYEQIQAHAFFKGTNWQEVYANGFNNTMTTKKKIPKNLT